MIMRAVAATVHDPSLYSSDTMDDEDYRDYLRQFLKLATNQHVVALDGAGIIHKLLVERVSEIRQRWPDLGALVEESLRRKHIFASGEQTKRIAEQVSPLFACANVMQKGQLTALSLAGEIHVDEVVVSKETEGLASCADSMSITERAKVQRLPKAGRSLISGGVSLIDKKRADIASEWFEPILKWGETVTLVDKQIGTAFSGREIRKRNWHHFKLTIDWLYRCWSTHSIVKRRWFEIITHPARDELGRMKEPSTDVAAMIWRDLGEYCDMRVTIVKEGKTAKAKRAGGDVTHERYLNSMPMDFTLSVGRGFDFLKEGEGETITQACTVSLLSEHPKDLSIILGLRKSGVTYPDKIRL
jgi:hypothetical protein